MFGLTNVICQLSLRPNFSSSLLERKKSSVICDDVKDSEYDFKWCKP